MSVTIHKGYMNEKPFEEMTYAEQIKFLEHKEKLLYPDKEVPSWYNVDTNIFAYKNVDLNTGDFFLYQTTFTEWGGTKKMMTAPKLGVFIETTMFDMASVCRCVVRGRGRQHRLFMQENNEIYPAQFVDIVLWSKSLHVFGVWKVKPNWKQLRRAYEKTFYHKKS